MDKDMQTNKLCTWIKRISLSSTKPRLDNTWKGIHYDADIYHQINIKTPGLLDDDCNYASEDADVLRHIIRPSHDRSSSKPSDTELTELVIKRECAEEDEAWAQPYTGYKM